MKGPLETDIPWSRCLARIGGWLLIEIDFGMESVSSARGASTVADGRQTRMTKDGEG